MKISAIENKLTQRLVVTCILSTCLLVTGCTDDNTENLEKIEAVDSSLQHKQKTRTEPEQDSGAQNTGNSSTLPQNSPEYIFSVSSESITLVGADLSRNKLIDQLVGIDEAWLLGDPLIDRQIDIDMRSRPIAAVLGQLLDDVDYQAIFERHEDSRSTLHTLLIGDAALTSGNPAAEIAEEITADFVSPVAPADGSIDAGEEYVKVLANRFSSGDQDEKKSVIIETELTEGGVAFLHHILQNDQDSEILIEVIRRLESGEEFGAKWALLQSLSHPNPVIQLEILESIEVWRDPTIKKYIDRLTTHYDPGVRKKALELVDDLNTYAEIGIAADPYGVDEVSVQITTPEQRAQRELKTEQRQKQDEERSRNRRPSATE